MRVTFVGASVLAVTAAEALVERGHEVVLIDRDAEWLDTLEERLDCGFVKGDGSRPAVLREVGPEQTDFLFAVSDSDEANILAALVGRSLGFGRVVPKVTDRELEPICTELGLDDVIVPDREVGMRLVDLVEGRDSPELTSVVRSGLRFFGFQVPAGVRDVEALGLPPVARVVARTRDEESILADRDTALREGDELVLIVEEEALDALRERFGNGSNGGKEDPHEG